MHPSTDIVIFGATGYTGRLIVRYLQAHPSRPSFTFSVAGRSAAKLKQLIRDVPGLERSNVSALEVDITDQRRVDEVVASARIVINTIGPFWKHSTPIIRSCARQGKHYVDITGELPWLFDMIHEFDFLAHKNGAIIIPSCGYDSALSEISVHLSLRTLKAHLSTSTVPHSIRSISAHSWKWGGISGGSLATMLSYLGEYPREKLGRIVSLGESALTPVKSKLPPLKPKLLYKLKLPSLKTISGTYFPLAPSNRGVVYRTWGLKVTRQPLDERPYTSESEFVYDEFIACRSTLHALITGVRILIFFAVMAFIPPLRWVVKKFFVASPGHGPSEKHLESSSIELTNVTSSYPTSSRSSTPETRVMSTIKGRGDPAYLLTSIIVSESALALLFDSDRLPSLARDGGGILTPMTALGDTLIRRLTHTGRFEFESVVVDG